MRFSYIYTILMGLFFTYKLNIKIFCVKRRFELFENNLVLVEINYYLLFKFVREIPMLD